EAATAEPLKSWARERAAKFDALVARIEQPEVDAKFAALVREVEDLCARGNASDAHEALLRLRAPKFPAAVEFRELQAEVYLKPLANFSRQNPAYFRALQTYEP